MKILYSNLRSILSKMDVIKTITNDSDPDIVTFTKTWTNSSITNGFLHIDGYNIIKRKDRNDTANGFGGGIITYAKSSLPCFELDLTLLDVFTEATGITIKTTQGALNILTVYRPHKLYNGGNTQQNNENLNELIKNTPKPYIICGDFNYPKICWPTKTADNTSTSFMDTLMDNYITQHVNFPTHTSGNILDLVLSDNDNIVHGVDDAGCIDTSDHTSLEIAFNIRPKQGQSMERWSWKRADRDSIKNELMNWDWQGALLELGASEAMDTLNRKIAATMERNIPKYTDRNRPRPPWMSQELLRAIRKKKRLWRAYTIHRSPAKLNEYKDHNKNCKKRILAAKRKFEQSLCEPSNMDTNKFFHYIKSRKRTKDQIGPLKDNTRLISDDQGIANCLNEFFCSVFTSESTEPPDLDLIKPDMEEFTDPLITLKKVEQKIKDLKRFGAPGPDGVFPSFIMDNMHELSPPLKLIIKKSMESAVVPNIWKKANVVPIFKKGSKFKAGNYRPISLTSITGRVCESIIKDHIVDHLTRNNLIMKSQFGFMKKRSFFNYSDFFVKK